MGVLESVVYVPATSLRSGFDGGRSRLALDSGRFRLAFGCVVVAMMLAASTVGFAGTPSLSATEFDPETDHDELTSGRAFTMRMAPVPERRRPRRVRGRCRRRSLRRDDRERVRPVHVPRRRAIRVRPLRGTFYEFAADIDGDRVVIDAEERDPQSIADELAVDFADAPDPIQETIETGEPVELTGDTPGG